MSRKLSRQLIAGVDFFQYQFICPGCGCLHGVRQAGWPMPQGLSVELQELFKEKWTFNENFEQPTITPSIHIKDKGETVCHSFVNGGKIMFLQDSKHDLAGEIVDLPNWN